MENWRHYLVEEKIHQPLFEDYAYVTGVLGISLPLDESGAPAPLTEELKKQILYEQMLFEGFWDGVVQRVRSAAGTVAGKFVETVDGIKQFGKDGWEVIKQLYHVATNPDLVDRFAGAVLKRAVFPITVPILKTLRQIIDMASTWGIPKFASAAKVALDLIQKIVKTVSSLSGWKKAVGVAGLAVGVKWLWDKVKDFVKPFVEQVKKLGSAITDTSSTAVQEFIEWLKGAFQEKVVSVIQQQFSGIIEKLISVTSGIKPWWDAAAKVVGGADLVIQAILPAISRFKRYSGQTKGIADEPTPPTPEPAPT
tara:strand:+ start:1749 stop:2675 length:927 start_codon:yes stop_codon:yes gene_type:complete